MKVLLFDDPVIRKDLLPFTFTRPVCEIRTGIFTIREKWEKYLEQSAGWLTESYLQEKYPITPSDDYLLINGAVCPDKYLAAAVGRLVTGEQLLHEKTCIALRTPRAEVSPQSKTTAYEGNLFLIDQPWKIFHHNAAQILSDFNLVKQGRTSAPILDPHTVVYEPRQIFMEAGAVVTAAVLNASTGPIYIGRNAEIQEGSVVRGPFVLGEGSVLNMASKMRGNITIGPACKVGGEVSNAVIFGYSNKAHDGFLGSSVLGEWCNLGADTNTSNLKNNYDAVKLWSYAKGGFRDTGLTFCGLMMGDHSKAGINTMFNSGTVTGVSANIFGDGYPRNFIPSFAWGGAAGFTTFQIDKALTTAERVMARRQVTLTEADKNILRHLYSQSAAERVWEKKS